VTENNFQTAVKYGSVALALAAIANIWAVMRYWEVYRREVRSQVQFQHFALREQTLQSVAQDFVTRANSDPQIAAIFRRAQAARPPTTAPETDTLSAPRP